MQLHRLAIFVIVILINTQSGFIVAQSQEESIFKQTCSACHTIGKGRLVGPDLMNVHQRQEEAWLIKFIKSSQSVIKGGDKYADSLFKAFNQVPMPDQANLSDDQIKGLLAYIREQSAGGAVATVATEDTAPALAGDAQRGRNLFVGNLRFANGGPGCNSCHNVDIKDYFSGGVLAKDLTQAITRLTEDGVKGVISGLAFPQMKQAYQDKPITAQEVADLTAFLKMADQQAASQASGSIGNTMIISGIAGVITLLVLFSFFWMNRKQRTVNYSIYKRQIKSM